MDEGRDHAREAIDVGRAQATRWRNAADQLDAGLDEIETALFPPARTAPG
jgi:hypothetical protein